MEVERSNGGQTVKWRSNSTIQTVWSQSFDKNVIRLGRPANLFNSKPKSVYTVSVNSVNALIDLGQLGFTNQIVKKYLDSEVKIGSRLNNDSYSEVKIGFQLTDNDN